MPRKLIYFCPETRGGVADYARAQAEAISKQGVDLLFLTCPSFDQSTPVSFRLIDGLKETPKNLSSFRWIRRYQHLQILLKNLAILRGLILSLHVKEVLWSSFFEYGSPFWAGHFQDLHRHGVRMGALLHDPIRDFQIGPHWWHQKSIRTATSLFDCLFTHLIPHHSSPHPNPLRDPKNLKKNHPPDPRTLLLSSPLSIQRTNPKGAEHGPPFSSLAGFWSSTEWEKSRPYYRCSSLLSE